MLEVKAQPGGSRPLLLHAHHRSLQLLNGLCLRALPSLSPAVSWPHLLLL
jgi:hypothetical protein